MRSDHRTGADAHPGTYDAEGPDADVGRELGLARDDRARIDHLEASGATIISACATSCAPTWAAVEVAHRSEEHTSELQSLAYLVCRLLLEKKKPNDHRHSCATQITMHSHAQT